MGYKAYHEKFLVANFVYDIIEQCQDRFLHGQTCDRWMLFISYQNNGCCVISYVIFGWDLKWIETFQYQGLQSFEYAAKKSLFQLNFNLELFENAQKNASDQKQQYHFSNTQRVLKNTSILKRCYMSNEATPKPCRFFISAEIWHNCVVIF